MGVDMELESKMYCNVSRSPKTGCHSHPHGSKLEVRDAKGKPAGRSYLFRSLDEDFSEISFDNSPISSCKSRPSEPAGVAGNEGLKRGSVYQSSKAVRRMKKMGQLEGRTKIELSHSSDTSLSFRIIDSLSQKNEASPLVQQKRLSLMSLNTNPKASSVSKTYTEPESPELLDLSFRLPSSLGFVSGRDVSSADRFFDISLDPEGREHCLAETIDRNSMQELNLRCDHTIGPLNDGNDLLERDTILTLHKSSSEKVRMRYLPCRSENDCSKTSPKARFNPIRKMLDPIMKSKSQRSPSVSVTEFGDVKTVGVASFKRNRTLRKSLLRDFSTAARRAESDFQSVNKDHSSSAVALSPAHLRGLLKLEYKHGAPFFKFSLKDPEDVLAAKTWRAGSAFNWVYTFHSLSSKRKSSSNGQGAKERHKESDMVGQMQVSCYLCSEMRNGGTFDNSVATEFLLYDIAHARRSLAAQESSQFTPDSVELPQSSAAEDLVMGPSFKLNDVSDSMKHKLQPKHASSSHDSDASTPYPWAAADLHPNLELAAIVIQVPFEMGGSSKYKREDKVIGKVNPNSIDFSMVEQRIDIPGFISPTNVKVVTPTGTHGLPSTKEGGGPSPLLDRWRSGGGCDCGGWDMACPLIVFGNTSGQNKGGHPLMENQQPLKLFVQGSKEKMPALTMTALGEGQYSVDFHAQLSKLQAFSICVALLHSGEVSTAVDQERNRQRLQHNSLKVLLEEEVRFLIEAVEEKRKVTKRMEEMLPSFVVHPPFSPFARV